MKILIVSDAWKPQLNGVVRTYEHLNEELHKMGHETKVIGPADFPLRYAIPGYKEIELAFMPYRRLAKMIEDYAPDTIHIATEANLGKAAAKYCAKKGYPYTTAYHTHFPDYLAKRVEKIFPPLAPPLKNMAITSLKKFHDKSFGIFIATQSLEDELKSWGFRAKMHRLTRGAKLDLFKPGQSEVLQDIEGPIALYVGRLAIEKNIEAFLQMEWAGTKVLVGHGPDHDLLKKRYPDAVFTGKKESHELADHFRAGDVYVFPSRTDTFGMVLVEAMACGLPIAAYNVTGPKDIVTEDFLGVLHEDNLAHAAKEALKLTIHSEKIYAHAQENYTWETVAQQFMDLQGKALCK